MVVMFILGLAWHGLHGVVIGMAWYGGCPGRSRSLSESHLEAALEAGAALADEDLQPKLMRTPMAYIPCNQSPSPLIVVATRYSDSLCLSPLQ